MADSLTSETCISCSSENHFVTCQGKATSTDKGKATLSEKGKGKANVQTDNQAVAERSAMLLTFH